MSNALIPFAEIEKMGTVIAKSGMFGIRTPEQAIALMLVAQGEGMHPALVARDFHIINGRPCLKADAMLARFQASGGKVEFKEYSDSRVTATFTHPQGGSLTVAWNLEMAQKAGLANKDSWRQYPRQMLRARVISEGVRSVFPGCISGFYTPEEIQDIEPSIEMTPEPIEVKQNPAEPIEVTEPEKKLSEAKTIEELKQVWGALSPQDQKRLKTLKDGVKGKLESEVAL
jgi:hypothetical protein